MSVSVLILTLNEAIDIAACIASVSFSDDIVVLDSFSTDDTVTIAQRAGARVVQRRFDDYAGQRSYGLHAIEYKHPWVLMLDADERVLAELAQEIAAVVAAAGDDVAMYRMRRRDHLLGRWIRGASGYPTWFGRLVRPERVSVRRAINEEYHAQGGIGTLRGHLDHYPFSKGISAWIQRHDRYSTMEARFLADDARVRESRAAHFSPDPVIRRRAWKASLYRSPGRPLVVFLGLYVWRRGFLEGRAGLVFCLLRAWYEFMIDCKRLELHEARRGRRI
jgi:glycosyltransferase involved in cell wall biosynthesis